MGSVPKAYMLKVRCGSSTYVKPDGSIGTAGKGALVSEDVSFTLAASQDQTLFQEVDGDYVVRRITPTEAERLQFFPDGWTDLTGCDAEELADKVAVALGIEQGTKEYKALLRNMKKWVNNTPDSPRYKAMGNSITTTVLEVLGRRIQAFDELHYDEIGLC